ncbi:hypothetical protein JOF29_008595 [Kribbella aluminosa]|uniref:Uncharacterized protein n=1 Tax=Kribbella aluminosa TaxID=416017 RepID=A0ABS4V0N9_9ACTN|nr:hypothetical protein [Kribbella aluminosa]MBP2357485.1 hypothetical protein [Kribbella aluminosa]
MQGVVLVGGELLGQQEVYPAALAAPGAGYSAVDKEAVGVEGVGCRGQLAEARGDEAGVAVAAEQAEI